MSAKYHYQKYYGGPPTGMCRCGRKATTWKCNEASCAVCARPKPTKDYAGVRRRNYTAKTRRIEEYHEHRDGTEAALNPRGHGSLDVLELRLAALSPAQP